MPIYDYECAGHGRFELARPMSASGDGAPCPRCGNLAPRVITAPRLQTLGARTRSAMERNEKSRHEPHVCTTGCHHRGPPSRAASKPSEKPKMVSYRGPRPWVVEHS
jgi:putative FmdB family regulatory protein